MWFGFQSFFFWHFNQCSSLSVQMSSLFSPNSIFSVSVSLFCYWLICLHSYSAWTSLAPSNKRHLVGIMLSGFQSFWHIPINVPAYLYKCPLFSCPIQYSLSQFILSAIDWHVCTGAFNFPFLDRFSALMARWQIVRNPCQEGYKLLIWPITEHVSGSLFPLWLRFSHWLIFLHLRHNSV